MRKGPKNDNYVLNRFSLYSKYVLRPNLLLNPKKEGYRLLNTFNGWFKLKELKNREK